MTTATEFRAANAGILTLVERDLVAFWSGLDLSRPRAARDDLLEFVPQLTSVYGEGAAAIAADWYDELRDTEAVPGRFRAIMAAPFPAEYVRQRVKYGAQHLFTSTPDDMLPFLLDAISEYVLQPGRDTIRQSSLEDPRAAGWQRITNPGACRFCLMLAGRGGVYRKETVGFASHGSCMCVARPSWDPNAPEVPVEAYRASERAYRKSQEQLEYHRERTRRYLNAMA